MTGRLIVKVEGLHKSFGELEVLRGVTLAAGQGDVVSILGASGSGKSTLLRCVNFLETPDAGTIEIDGGRIDTSVGPPDAKRLSALRARLGMVFQSFNLWSHLTVRENVMLAPMRVLGRSRAEAGEAADRYLHRVGVWERRDIDLPPVESLTVM